jgi:hypothetical protein
MKNKIITLYLIFLIHNFVSAQISYGNKPLSLGSAYTANYGDVYSIYTNPAGLYDGKIFDLKLDILASANFTGNILYNVNQIVDCVEKYNKIRDAQQYGGALDVTQISALFNGIKNLVEINKPGKGVIIQSDGGIAVKIKNFALSVRNVSNIGLKPYIDTGFSLSTYTVTSTPDTLVLSSLKFADGGSYEGVEITTDTLKYPQLESTRNELVNAIGWIVSTLENFGVEISSEVKSNYEGIANALINLAKDNGVSDEEIKNAVTQLNDKNLQELITTFVNNMLNKNSSFVNNESALVLKGVNYTEILLATSYEIIDNLLLGAVVKYFIGKTVYYNFKVFQEKDTIDFNDITEFGNKLVRNSQAVGIDVGTIYKLPVSMVETSVGLVIKNLLEPEFALASTDEKLKLPRQVSIGVSGKLLKIISLNIDYDLNKIETFVEGYDVQNLGLGLEINPPFLQSLRVGYIKNLAYENDQLYTFGLGIKIFVVNIDIVGAVYPQETKISKDLTLFANNLSIGFTLGVTF